MALPFFVPENPDLGEMFGLPDIDLLQPDKFQDCHEGNHHHQLQRGIGEKIGEDEPIFLCQTAQDMFDSLLHAHFGIVNGVEGLLGLAIEYLLEGEDQIM